MLEAITDRSSPIIGNNTAVVYKAKELISFPMNLMMATDDGIMYAALGLIPDRNVALSSYTKIGSRPEAVWKGKLDSYDMPYVVNPDKGYLVTTNNFVGSSRMKSGVSLQRTFPTRTIRISEMIEEMIA